MRRLRGVDAVPEAVLTVAQVREAEQQLIETGASALELMQRAGTGAAEWVWRIAGGRPVTVLAGPGNNGGDGYIIAETLRQRGSDVQVVAPLPPQTTAASQARALYQGPIVAEGRGGLCVDCLFGTGLTGPLSEELADVLHKARREHDILVAVDLPSGVEADTGRLLGAVEPADVTLALGAWKQAHWLMPSSAIMGERRLVPIGLEIKKDAGSLSAPPHLQPPAADAHKYSRGMVIVVGGGMPGAALLSSEAALRSGAGYVRLVTDAPHPLASPELVVSSGPTIPHLADDRVRAVLVGPGLGRSEQATARLKAVLGSARNLVLDADALALLTPEIWEGRTGATVMTPHAGEMAMLCHAFAIGESGKVAQAEALARATGAVVLAKGADNILTDGCVTRYFPSMPSWLSIAGTGDVLAGLVTGRLGVQGDPMRAAEEAVWLHGRAAQRCGPALTPTALISEIPAAYAEFL